MDQAAANRLALERERAIEQVDVLARMLNQIIDASSSVATDDEHDPEGQTIAFERAQAAALVQQARQRVQDLDTAIERLRVGTYGICEDCGQPIDPERLDARPAARTCIKCASSR
jgi:DnaK suppressor protein